MTTKTKGKKDDSAVQRLVPTRVRIIVQSRKPQKGKDTSYGQVPGHALTVPVHNLREFRRLWHAVEKLVEGATWRDVRPASPATELPAAGVPAVGDQP